MVFVTLHGGSGPSNSVVNNIQAYDKKGRLVATDVLQQPAGIALNELRGIGFFGGLLYVVNANRDQSGVLCYRGAGTSYRFVSKFVSSETGSAIVHPFDFAFDNAGHCYVSSQDTNVVTRLLVSPDGTVGTPAPLAPALPSTGQFAPGTFVASSVANLCGMTTTAVPSPQGLEYSDDGVKKKHSVRGLTWLNGFLYVVDQPAGRVKIYDAGGHLTGQSNQVDSPVHVQIHDGVIYVTGDNRILVASVPTRGADFTLAPIPGLHIPNTSGIAFTEDGDIYVASRTGKELFKFDANFGAKDFHCLVPDNPEFLLHV